MNNKEAITVLEKYMFLNEDDDMYTEALDLAIKALEIVDIPHQKDYVVIKGKKVYITQGHIDALLEYERNQTIKEVVESFTKPFNVDFPKDFLEVKKNE